MPNCYGYSLSFQAKRKKRKVNVKPVKLSLGKKVIIMMSVIIIFLFLIPFILQAMFSNSLENEFHIVTVKQGDNLWQIARRYCQPHDDLRKMVFEIKRVNRLTSAEILPGQELKIPQS